MSNFALIRFERLHSQDDPAIRTRYEARKEEAPAAFDVFDFWDEIVQEMRCCLLPVDGARPLDFRETGGDRYVMLALVPCGDHDADSFADRLNHEAYDQGMGGDFEVIEVMPAELARSKASDPSVAQALRKRRRGDGGMQALLIQIGGHLMYTLAVIACLMAEMDRITMVACCAIAGGIFHTIADLQVDPGRGGARLPFLLISNAVFSLLMTIPITLLLP